MSLKRLGKIFCRRGRRSARDLELSSSAVGGIVMGEGSRMGNSGFGSKGSELSADGPFVAKVEVEPL